MVNLRAVILLFVSFVQIGCASHVIETDLNLIDLSTLPPLIEQPTASLTIKGHSGRKPFTDDYMWAEAFQYSGAFKNIYLNPSSSLDTEFDISLTESFEGEPAGIFTMLINVPAIAITVASLGLVPAHYPMMNATMSDGSLVYIVEVKRKGKYFYRDKYVFRPKSGHLFLGAYLYSDQPVSMGGDSWDNARDIIYEYVVTNVAEKIVKQGGL